MPARAWLGALLALLALCAAQPCPASAAEESLAGTWAMLCVLSDTVTFPLVGELARTSTLLRRVTIAANVHLLTLTTSYCSVAFDNGPALSTAVDPSFPRSLAPTLVTATLDPSGGGTDFTQSWSTELHGVRLEHPESDPLPTSSGDPRVIDQDGDGKPGITVHACALGVVIGDVYVVQRLRTRLAGRVVTPDRIEGRVEGSVEQVILGATNALFVGAVVSRPDPVASRSYFVLQRVEPDAACDDLVACRGQLFGR